MVYLGGLGDREKRARMQLDRLKREREERRNEYIASRTVAAQTGDVTPEIINPFAHDETEMSWDLSSGWKDRKRSELRQKRFTGKAHMPKQFIDHETHLEPVYESEEDLAPFQEGACCVRCRNWQPDDEVEHKRLHRRLSQVTGFAVPPGLNEKDCCCYCGGRLDTQRNVA